MAEETRALSAVDTSLTGGQPKLAPRESNPNGFLGEDVKADNGTPERRMSLVLLEQVLALVETSGASQAEAVSALTAAAALVPTATECRPTGTKVLETQ